MNQLHVPDAQIASAFEGRAGINLVEADLSLSKEHHDSIGMLAEKLGVAIQDVATVYTAEFTKLAAGARVTNFLIVLALSRTRSILSARSRTAAH